uniref:Glycine receptor, beta subunit n=1 Tax=Mus musculus TaxID=10090 RepID=E9PV81_MOUSE
MKFSLAISFFILMSLLFEDACAKEKSSKKGKGKKKQYLCPSSTQCAKTALRTPPHLS